MTIRDVAHHLGVSWDVIKDLQKRDLSRRYGRPKLKHLRHIAIDEIAVAKGHRYLRDPAIVVWVDTMISLMSGDVRVNGGDDAGSATSLSAQTHDGVGSSPSVRHCVIEDEEGRDDRDADHDDHARHRNLLRD